MFDKYSMKCKYAYISELKFINLVNKGLTTRGG